ncbi:MAG: 50S ribosomal protein L10 [Thermodesulfobacteriota bacterium]
MNKQQKEEVVAGLTDKLALAKAVVVTDFKGLKVGEMDNLRRKVREAGAEYEVAKNTLAKRAAQGLEASVLADLLVGNSGLATTRGDPAALAKALVEFVKGNDKVTIKGGALAGRLLDPAQIKALADLPGREILLATLFGVMNAVPTGLVRVLAAVPQGFLRALAAIRDQKGAQTAGA